jgi:hypothetical protein
MEENQRVRHRQNGGHWWPAKPLGAHSYDDAKVPPRYYLFDGENTTVLPNETFLSYHSYGSIAALKTLSVYHYQGQFVCLENFNELDATQTWAGDGGESSNRRGTTASNGSNDLQPDWRMMGFNWHMGHDNGEWSTAVIDGANPKLQRQRVDQTLFSVMLTPNQFAEGTRFTNERVHGGLGGDLALLVALLALSANRKDVPAMILQCIKGDSAGGWQWNGTPPPHQGGRTYLPDCFMGL